MARAPKTIRTIAEKNLHWQHIARAGERELQFLEEHYGFDPLDLHDCLPPLQRPKLIVRDAYLFLILNIPCFTKNGNRIYTAELDIFVTKRGVVTVSNETIPSLENFLELLESDGHYSKQMLSAPAVFFEQLLDEVLDDMFPKLLQISNEIERLNANLLENYSHETLNEILRLKNNLISFQKAVQPCKDLFSRIEPLVPQFLCNSNKQCPTFHRLISHTTEIWDNLLMYNQAVEAIQGIHMNMTSIKLNERVKTLTVFSIWLAASGVIATLLSAGAQHTPFVHEPFGFWKILAIFSLPSLGILIWFRGRKLL